MATEPLSKISGSTKQTASLILGKMIALLVTFAMPLFLTRYLTKSDYGTFSQFYLVVFFFTGFFSLGMQSNLFYFYPGANDQDKKSLVFQTFLFLSLLSVVGIAFVGIPQVSKYIIGEGELINYKTFIITGIFLLMPVLILEPLYVVKKDNLTSIFYPPAEVMLRLAFVICLAMLNPGLNSVFTGIIMSASICYVFMIIYLLKDLEVRNINKRIFNLKLEKEQLKYSLPFGIAVSLNILAERFDKILCILFLSQTAYASYSIAFFGIPGIMQVYDSLSKVHLIRMTLKYQENKLNDIADIYKSLVTKTYSFSIPLLMIVLLYAKKIIVFLFTSNYIDSVQLFRAYLFSILIFMLGAGLILRATGKTMDTLKSYVYTSIITVPATYLLIKNFGVWGAMSGALLSITLNRILIIAFEIRVLKTNFRNYFPWKNFSVIFLISFISLIPFILLETFFNTGIIITMIYGVLYLFIVSLLEIKYNLFVLDSILVRNWLYALNHKIRSHNMFGDK